MGRQMVPVNMVSLAARFRFEKNAAKTICTGTNCRSENQLSCCLRADTVIRRYLKKRLFLPYMVTIPHFILL